MYRAWFDGSVKPIKGRAFIGYIIMDHNDNVIRAFANEVHYTKSIDKIEAIALNELLKIVIQHSLHDIEICGDSLHTIMRVKNGSQQRLHRIIRNKLAMLENVSLNYVPRKFNTYADRLCHFVSKRKEHFRVSNTDINKLNIFNKEAMVN